MESRSGKSLHLIIIAKADRPPTEEIFTGLQAITNQRRPREMATLSAVDRPKPMGAAAEHAIAGVDGENLPS